MSTTRNRAARRRIRLGTKLRLMFLLLVLILLLAAIAPYSLVTIPPGSVGVHWKLFTGGTVTEYHYGEGFHLILPWDKVYIFDARVRRRDETVSALTREGLHVDLTIWLTYTVNPKQVGFLHRMGGPNYENTVLHPLLASQTVRMVALRSVEELYGKALGDLTNDIVARIGGAIRDMPMSQPELGPLVNVVGLNFAEITLPAPVQASIEYKLQTEQDALRYEYVTQRESLESQRKAIEAAGIRDFQEIVSKSISDSYLRWKGIDATLQLAQSDNAKIVVVGSGADGLPLILGGFGETPSSASGAGSPQARAPMSRVPPPLILEEDAEGLRAATSAPTPAPERSAPSAGGGRRAAGAPQS